MCDEFQQYLYPILYKDFQQAIDQNDILFNNQYKNCFEYLDQVDVSQDLIDSISDLVQQDFQGTHPLDKNKIISLIALAKVYTLEVMDVTFVHFTTHHKELFFNIVFRGKKILSADLSAFLMYKYCCDTANQL